MMEGLFNDLITDVVSKRSPDESKLEVFKREWNARQQKIVAQKTLYENNHETPRREQIELVNAYFEENKRLKREYMSTRGTSQMHAWLRHSAKVPTREISSVYTFYS